ncbi:MAG: 7TM domain-containing protein [Verrucomicrobiia bacterium]
MNARRATPWVACLLVLLGIVLVGLRAYTRRELQLASGESLWRLTYTVKFQTETAGARLSAAFPFDTAHCRVFRQNVLHPELQPERLRSSLLASRGIDLLTLYPGEQNMTAKFDIHLSRRARFRAHDQESSLSAQARAEWLRSDKMVQADSAVVVETLQNIRRETPPSGDLVQRLFEYCHTQIAAGEDAAPSDATGALKKKAGSPIGRTRAFAALCRASKTPARVVTGFVMEENDNLEPRVWVEAWLGDRWVPFEPENGFARELPYNYLAVRRDGGDIVRVARGSGLETHFAALRLPPGPGAGRSKHHSLVALADLTRLPLEMHEVLSLILLLPIGGLVTAFFRTIIGIRTFGTFTPTLIALSFVFADWRTGVFVFVLVLLAGLISRTFLDRLKLLMVPRLSTVLTLVVLCIIFCVSLLDMLRLTPGAQAVLLPMVILTMTIERFYLTSEEDGTGFAFQLLAGTVVVAFCCYLVLRWAAVGRFLFMFPEAHLFTIAVLILMGRYTGYRLTELLRFRDFGPTHKPTEPRS